MAHDESSGNEKYTLHTTAWHASYTSLFLTYLAHSVCFPASPRTGFILTSDDSVLPL